MSGLTRLMVTKILIISLHGSAFGRGGSPMLSRMIVDVPFWMSGVMVKGMMLVILGLCSFMFIHNLELLDWRFKLS